MDFWCKKLVCKSQQRFLFSECSSSYTIVFSLKKNPKRHDKHFYKAQTAAQLQ